MPSMQSRLTVSLTAAAIVLSAAVGLILHRAIGAILVRQFDHTLQDKARGLSLLVSRELNGRLEFEYAPASMPEYQRAEHAEYFQVQFTDGRVYVQSKTLGNGLLPQFTPDDTAHDVMLPTGRTGRLVCQAFFPRPEDEIEPLPRPLSEMPTVPAGQQMIITIARDRAELDGGLRELSECLVLGAVGLAALTAAVAMWIVRRALLPLRSVAELAADIDVPRLDRRFPDSNLPAELEPICSRLNDLLRASRAALQRERRFTADVAHELRTPIAELRSVTEVALKWPDDPNCARQALVDAHAISRQMGTLVTTLLSLVRSSRKDLVAVEFAPVRLSDELRRIAAALESSSPARPIHIQAPADAIVLAEQTLLNSVLTNLLGNALEYATPGSAVRCRTEMAENHWLLSIENQTADMTEEDLKHLFEPFWRKDRARTGTGHAGLGLSLVAGYCKIMDVKISADIPQPSTLRMTLTLPAAGNAPVTLETSAPVAAIDEPVHARSGGGE